MSRSKLEYAIEDFEESFSILKNRIQRLYDVTNNPSSEDQLIKALGQMNKELTPMRELVRGNIAYVNDGHTGDGYRYSQGDFDI